MTKLKLYQKTYNYNQLSIVWRKKSNCKICIKKNRCRNLKEILPRCLHLYKGVDLKMKKVIRALSKFELIATKKYITPVCITLAIILIFMEKGPFGTTKLRQLSGGKGMLDMEFGYSISQVYSMLDVIGNNGQQLYIKLLCLDFLFMIFYVLFQSLIIAALIKKAGLNDYFKIVNILPFLRSALDIIENFLLLKILLGYPLKMPALVNISSIITISKLILNIIIIGFIVLLGILVIKQNIASKVKMQKGSERV